MSRTQERDMAHKVIRPLIQGMLNWELTADGTERNHRPLVRAAFFEMVLKKSSWLGSLFTSM